LNWPGVRKRQRKKAGLGPNGDGGFGSKKKRKDPDGLKAISFDGN